MKKKESMHYKLILIHFFCCASEIDSLLSITQALQELSVHVMAQEEKDRALITAAGSGTFEEIKKLLHDGANINTSIGGKTPLCAAINRDDENEDIAVYLIEKVPGIDLNMKCNKESPLYRAILLSHFKTVLSLLTNGAKPEWDAYNSEISDNNLIKRFYYLSAQFKDSLSRDIIAQFIEKFSGEQLVTAGMMNDGSHLLKILHKKGWADLYDQADKKINSKK